MALETDDWGWCLLLVYKLTIGRDDSEKSEEEEEEWDDERGTG